MTSDDVSSLSREIEEASRNRDLGGFSGTITRALAQRAIHELTASPGFWASVDQLMASVRVEHDEAVLLALSELGRLGTTLKTRGIRADEIVTRFLEERVPAHFSFGDGDDRHYAAIAWERSGLPLDPAVAARTAVLEDSSEKARRAWLRMLLVDRGAAGAIRAMTTALGELQWLRLPGSHRSFDSAKERSRRVALLLKGTRTELDADRVQVDDSVVKALSDFVAAAFAYVSRPDRFQDTAKAVDEFVALVLHIIRIKFRLLTDPDIYATSIKTRRWLPDGGWQRVTSRSKTVERLRGTLIEGLVLLLKQGKVSSELAEIHRQLSSTPNKAQAELARVAVEERDLSPDMRTWLETGDYGAEEVEIEISDTDDTAIAWALLAAHELPTLDVSRMTSESGELKTTTPATEEAVRDFVDRAEELKNQVLSVAQRRSLSVFGEVGAVTEFSPHAHRHTGEGDVARVRVIRAGVEATARRGSKVIIRAIVS